MTHALSLTTEPQQILFLCSTKNTQTHVLSWSECKYQAKQIHLFFFPNTFQRAWWKNDTDCAVCAFAEDISTLPLDYFRFVTTSTAWSRRSAASSTVCLATTTKPTCHNLTTEQSNGDAIRTRDRCKRKSLNSVGICFHPKKTSAISKCPETCRKLLRHSTWRDTKQKSPMSWSL